MQNRHDSLPELDAAPASSRLRSVTERVPPIEVPRPEVRQPSIQEAAGAELSAPASGLDAPWLEFWRRVHALALELDAGAETKGEA